MNAHKPWYKKSSIVVPILLILLIIGVGYAKSQQTEQPTNTLQKTLTDEQISKLAAYQATDNTATDQQDESKVNFARLKAFIQKFKNQPIDTASLDSQINQIISANPDIKFGVSIAYLNTGQVHNYGLSSAFTAASVTKLLTAIDYYKQVELGNRSLSTVMANGQTAQSNIEDMIVVSDNDAWHILNENLGYQQMQDYARSIGINSYYYGDNIISASDVTKLLTDMYQRQLINETNVQQLLSYMERANYRDLVIPAVPTTDTVYHKAGEYAGNLHDATIITNSTNTIVLTIFTYSTGSYSKSRISSLMQQITTPTLSTFGLN